MNDIVVQGETLEVLILLGSCTLAIFILAFVVHTIRNISSNDKRIEKLEQEVFPTKKEGADDDK